VIKGPPVDEGNGLSFQTNWPPGFISGASVAGHPFTVYFASAGAAQAISEDGSDNGDASPQQVTHLTVLHPCIGVTKSCVNQCTPFGQLVGFEGTVTNCSASPATALTVTLVDDPPATINFAQTTSSGRIYDGTLKNGESLAYTGSYAPTVPPCTLNDTITAIGADITGFTVTNSASASCQICNNPGLTVVKSCPNNVTFSSSAQAIPFRVAVTNTGNIPITALGTDTDNLGDNIAIGPFSLDPGDGVVFNGSITVPARFCGLLTDAVSITGSSVCGGTVTQTVACNTSVSCCPECVNPVLGLGAASGCTVLELGAAMVSITGPAGGLLGNICIAPHGTLSMSGSEFITGTVELGLGATFNNSSSGVVGGVLQNVDLSSEIAAAYAAAASDAALPCTQSFGTLDGVSVKTITGVSGVNVICVQNVTLSGRQILLKGPADATFIFSVKGQFVLTGGGAGPQIRVDTSTGLKPSAVLYNILGKGPDVAFSGGGGGVNCCAAVVDGTILAPLRNINLSPGLVNGEVISALNINIVSGSSVRCPPCPPE
jgi:hypothetical protein